MNRLFFRLIAGAALLLAGWMLLAAKPVQARGLLDFLFGGGARRERATPPPKPAGMPKARKIRRRSRAPVIEGPRILLAGGKQLDIMVLGDSLGTNLWWGLSEALRPHGNVEVIKKTRLNSGLVRDDYYDWPQAVKDLATRTKMDIAVIMIGVNDSQDMRGEAGLVPFQSPEWERIYSARIDRILKALTQRGIVVYWVGLPIMRSESLSANMSYLNDLIQEQVTRAGVKYIDIWDAFATETGRFARFGPDISGRNRRLRTKNGIRFTRAGARKLAHFVEKEIIADFATGQIVAGGNGKGVQDMLHGKPDEPLMVSDRMARLLAPELAAEDMQDKQPGGNRRVRELSYIRAIIRGEPQPARRGRADDFSWPRD